MSGHDRDFHAHVHIPVVNCESIGAGLFVYGYCFYYYLARSDMSGFMQQAFYFGYMFMVCYAFSLMLGTIGYRASLTFVRHIYRAIKCE